MIISLKKYDVTRISQSEIRNISFFFALTQRKINSLKIRLFVLFIIFEPNRLTYCTFIFE